MIYYDSEHHVFRGDPENEENFGTELEWAAVRYDLQRDYDIFHELIRISLNNHDIENMICFFQNIRAIRKFMFYVSTKKVNILPCKYFRL